MENKENYEVTLVAQGEIFDVKKNPLILSSPYFKNIVQKKQDSCYVIRFSTKNLETSNDSKEIPSKRENFKSPEKLSKPETSSSHDKTSLMEQKIPQGFEFSTTNRGGICLMYENYKYIKHKTIKKSQYWRCPKNLAVGLIVAALGTKWWVVAKAKRLSNPDESDGKINLGLFEGEKKLNVKYGWREYMVHVTQLAHTEREFLLYGAWIATIACLVIGLLFSTLCAIFAVLNTATNQYLALLGVPGLYVWNLLAGK
ncbi:unnamed protein product [Allacma fusca]|uniref:FLYWCH-type domain-containing protein n=1 Tax=Allacma fusca TaxID=39272 RepID=A0A8J2JPM1_9HEXA|nr:unnamed protein product [Allacma fusca]